MSEVAVGWNVGAGTRCESTLRGIAAHEAAHAVVAASVGCWPRRVTLDGDESLVSCDAAEYLPVVDAAFAGMTWAAAGPLMDGRTGRTGAASSGDIEFIARGAFTILAVGQCPVEYIGAMSMDALVLAARERASRILERRANAFEDLVRVLCAQRTVQGNELTAILEGSDDA